MILYDTPRRTQFRLFRQTAHMMSTLPGREGTDELLNFAHGIGLSKSWLQRPGRPSEHFDLFDGAITRASRAGAEQVSARDLVKRCIWPKRAALKAERSS